MLKCLSEVKLQLYIWDAILEGNEDGMWEVKQHIQQRKPPAVGEQMAKYVKKQESCSKQGEG